MAYMVHGFSISSDMQYGFPVHECVTDYIKLLNNRPDSELNHNFEIIVNACTHVP